MKIIRSGNTKKPKKMRGTCRNCNCHVEVMEVETKTLIDRDTTSGMATQYVKCPECGTDHLWVK